jgi:hypothetical protein
LRRVMSAVDLIEDATLVAESTLRPAAR